MRPGDTLPRIAATHGLDWRDVVAANRAVLADPSIIYPGQVLSLGVAISASDAGPSYTVRSGDTLSRTAAAHQVGWQDLYAANRSVIGAGPGLIFPGQVLRVG